MTHCLSVLVCLLFQIRALGLLDQEIQNRFLENVPVMTYKYNL